MNSNSNEDMTSPKAGSKNDDFEIQNFKNKLEEAGDVRIVLPGDYIGEGFIAGHGTYENQKDTKIYANMAGVVH